MQLLVDAGNSNLKWALVQDKSYKMQYKGLFAINTHPHQIDSQFNRHWGELKPNRVLVSHVGGEQFLAIFNGWVAKHWGLRAEFQRVSKVQMGVRNGYKDPSTFGIDRWMALIAGHHNYQKPGTFLSVVDIGTCTTIDILDPNGTHLGGSLLPGAELMINSVSKILKNRASSRRNFESNLTDMSSPHQKTLNLFNDNTHDGLIQGACFAQIAVVEKLIRDLPTYLPGPCEFLITGSGANAFSRPLANNVTLSPHLVLEGMAVLIQQQAQSPAHN